MRETFPIVSPIAIEKYREVALSGQPINFEIYSQVANKYLDIRAFIPKKGKIALILRDISKTKQVQESLHERDTLLSAFLEQLPVGISLFDAQGRYLIKNKIFQRFVGEFIPSKDPEISPRWKAWGSDGNLLDKSKWPGARALQGENVTPGIDMFSGQIMGEKCGCV
jgi:PAS domain-containing protein